MVVRQLATGCGRLQSSLCVQVLDYPILPVLLRLRGTQAVGVTQTLRHVIFTRQCGHPVLHWTRETGQLRRRVQTSAEDNADMLLRHDVLPEVVQLLPRTPCPKMWEGSPIGRRAPEKSAKFATLPFWPIFVLPEVV